MPIYEYECVSCEKVHELMQKYSDKPMEKCPECGKPVKKLMSLSSFALKGKGWYTTDYKKPSGSKDSSKETSDGNSTEKTESGDSISASGKKDKSDLKKESSTKSKKKPESKSKKESK